MRMLLIRVRSRPDLGAGEAGGAEPLAEGGGTVLVVLAGTTGSVMTDFLKSGDPGVGDLAWFPWG
jgi:hypothetical protein